MQFFGIMVSGDILASFAVAMLNKQAVVIKIVYILMLYHLSFLCFFIGEFVGNAFLFCN